VSAFFYEELPYAAFRPACENQATADSLSSEIGGNLSLYELSGTGLGEIKRRAAKCYGSQKEAAMVGAFIDHCGERINERVWSVRWP
jgi:hypothetical protein